MRKVSNTNRLLALVLCLCMVLGLMPGIPITVSAADATETTTTEKNITLGTSALKGGQASNVYFGRYQQSSLGNTQPTTGTEGVDWIKSTTAVNNGQGAYYKKEPIKWRVLSNADGKALLLSDKNLDVVRYNNSYTSAIWETSTIRTWLNGTNTENFYGSAFSTAEKGVIADTVIGDTTDKVFLLSIAEAQNTSYFADDNSRKSVNTAYVYGGGKIGSSFTKGVGETNIWWLRSPGNSNIIGAAYVNNRGVVKSSGDYVDSSFNAVRPAFNLNLSSVLFTSAASGGKPTGTGLTTTTVYTGNEYKLTLLDSTRNFAVSETTVTGCAGLTVSLTYSNATIGTNEYISAMIVDANGEVVYYGQLAQATSASGTVTLTIPSDIAAGNYTLKLFNEQINGDYMTDYSGAFVDVSLTVLQCNYSDGICTVCGAYEPAVLNDSGVYEIGNLGQLMWFAQNVNTAHTALLTADITIDNSVVWTPIGLADGASSTFNGGGHTITFANTNAGSTFGLFGTYNYSVIENLNLAGSISCNTTDNVGVLINSAYRTTIRNVVSTCDITNSATSGGTAGLVGYFGGKDADGLYSLIENCAVYADITGGGSAGGLIGNMWGGSQYCTVRNSAYVGNVAGTVNSGAIVGANGNNSYTTSTFNTVYFCETDGSGWIGSAGSGLTSLTNVEAKTAAQFASGEVAYLLGDAFGQSIGEQEHPVLGGAKVYYGYVSCAEDAVMVYTNIEAGETKPDHSWNDATCTAPKTCDVCGATEGEAVSHTVSYTAQEGLTIKGVCESCGDSGSVTLIPTGGGTYTGYAFTSTYEGEGILNGLDAFEKPTITGCCENGCINVGDHTVTMTLGDQSVSTGFTITPKTLTISLVNANNKSYDGTPDLTSIYSVFLDGVVVYDEGTYDGAWDDVRDDVKLVYENMVYKVDGVVPGTYTSVDVSGVTITGKDAGNYVIAASFEDVPLLDSMGYGFEIHNAQIWITAHDQLLTGDAELDQSQYSVEGLEDQFTLQGVSLYENSYSEIEIDPYSISIYLDGEDVTEYFDITVHNGNLSRVCEGHEYDENGFCATGECSSYEPAVKSQTVDEWGSEIEVYEIYNAGQLYWFAEQINTYGNHYINGQLMDDITVNEDLTAENLRQWTPIGKDWPTYCGMFEGNDYTISGLYVNDPEMDYVGLFGYTDYAYPISNIHLTNSYFEGDSCVGGLFGYAGSYISGCTVSDSVTVKGNNSLGGIAGDTAYGELNNSWSAATVIANENTYYYGGLVGYNNLSINNCYTTGASLVGANNDSYGGSLNNSYYLSEEETEDGGKTAAQFASGEVAYLLQSGIKGEEVYDEETGSYVTLDPEHIWGQTIGEDAYPVLGGAKVYEVTNCKGETAYSNTESTDGHDWSDATCTDPKTCSVCGATEGDALGHSYDAETHKCVCGKLEPITVNISWNGTLIGDWEWTEDYGTRMLLPTSNTPDGYTFLGYAESEGGEVVCTDGEFYTFTKNVTLYAVFEKNPVYFDLWVQGVQVSDRNAADILGNGTVTYDAATNTLYLNNATISGAAYGIEVVGDLNLNITGSNRITAAGGESGTMGINVKQGMLTIDGTGSLYIQCDAAVDASYGILASLGLHIKGGSITAIAGAASISSGVKTAASCVVTVDGGATLTASGDPDGRYFGMGINAMTVTGEGTVNAIALLMPHADENDFTEYLVVYGNATLEEDSPAVGFYQVMEGATLTVAEGIKLDLSNVTADKTILDGTIVNNGTVVLPDSYTYATIPTGITGGTVVIGGSTYIWNGEKYVCGNHVDADNSGRCDNCNELMQPALLRMVSISLKGNIALNYYMLLSDEVLADSTAYMQFTMADGEIIQIPVSEGVKYEYEGETYYVFSCAVNAKEMTDDVISQFFYEGGSTKEHTYNVQTYAKHILANYDDEATKNLITSMLNYGAASQTHFGYNTDNMANAELAAPDYSDVTIEGFDAVAGQGTELAKFYSASLILKSETTLRFFFQVDSSAAFTATYNGQALEVKQRGGLHYVDVVGIAAKDLDENVTITISDGTNTAEVSFNPMSYCQGVLNDTTGAFDQEMKDLVAALYLYNQAANVYFKES